MSGASSSKQDGWRARVTASYRAAYTNPIHIRKGEKLEVQPKETEYTGWIWCVNGTGKGGWVPERYVERAGNVAVALRDYEATELSVQIGDEIVVLEAESGWLWCVASDGSEGWIPTGNTVPITLNNHKGVAMKKVAFPINKKEWAPSLIPGPLTLISTCNRAKEPNVAPKSWLQMAAFEPPTLMFSGSKQNTTEKNILETGCFAVNLVDSSMAAKTYGCIEWFGRDRIGKMGITLSPAGKIGAPLVDQCRAHLECVLRSTKEVGGGFVVFGEIVAALVREDILAAPPEDKYRLLDQVVFLENGLYARVRDACPVQAAKDELPGRWTRYVITLIRTDKPMTEALVRRHVTHLKDLDRRGRLVLCGPFQDHKGGMAIVRADSLDEAGAIAEADPFVKEGAETYELRAWELSCEENNHMGMG